MRAEGGVPSAALAPCLPMRPFSQAPVHSGFSVPALPLTHSLALGKSLSVLGLGLPICPGEADGFCDVRRSFLLGILPRGQDWGG